MSASSSYRFAFALFFCVAMIDLSCRNSRDTNRQTNAGQINVDSGYVQKAIINHNVALGLLDEALANATSDQLKKDARMMKDDHKRMMQDLQAFSQKMNYPEIVIDTESSSRRSLDLNRSMKGKEWDSVWLNVMREQDKKMVQDINTVSRQLKDPPLKTLVNAAVLVMQNHIQIIDRMPASM